VRASRHTCRALPVPPHLYRETTKGRPRGPLASIAASARYQLYPRPLGSVLAAGTARVLPPNRRHAG
jgi:hypothetical protein